MQYMMLIYSRPEEVELDGDPQTDPVGPVWGAYTKAMIDAGVMVSGEALHPASTATTVRLRNGERVLHDGPYADTKEHLGGFYIIEVPSLDVALEWAARCPAAPTGAVELRPVVDLSNGGA
jgi:hypothetical protein